jgi:hypothetical protein
MSFVVVAHTEPASRFLDDLGRKQLPFATALALNATNADVQAGVRNVVTSGRTFVIRTDVSRKWLRNAIKIERGDRATKQNLRAAVTIRPPGKGGGRSGLLGFLEEGGVRTSQFSIGSGQVFGPGSVVIPARRTPGEVIPRGLYPSMTGLQERRAIDGSLSAGRLKGKRKTFAIRTGTQEGLVLQRVGRKGSRSTRVLFVIKPRVRVPGRHYLGPTGERVATLKFPDNLDRALDQALRTAR